MRQKLRGWFSGLSRTTKFLLVAGGVLLCGIAANGGQSANNKQVIQTENTAAIKRDNQKESQQKESQQQEQPKITVKEEVITEDIAFQKQTRETPSLNKGEARIGQVGRLGVLNKTYKITFTDGAETSRDLVSEVVTMAAVDEVTLVGTYVAPAPKSVSMCDTNYSGCVPIASDVDCAGGSGNGPAYANGPIRVLGYDKYGLDRDGDGVACDS